MVLIFLNKIFNNKSNFFFYIKSAGENYWKVFSNFMKCLTDFEYIFKHRLFKNIRKINLCILLYFFYVTFCERRNITHMHILHINALDVLIVILLKVIQREIYTYMLNAWKNMLDPPPPPPPFCLKDKYYFHSVFYLLHYVFSKMAKL